MKDIVVIYHKNCPDGFGGAWAAWKKLKNKADYIATEPRELPDEELKDKEIYIVDNSYPKEILQKLIDTNKSVVVLDHHESSKDDVQAFPQNIFDNSHSGAVLAWNYFHPKRPVPRLLKYVEDEDLWKHEIPFSQDINKFITAHPFEFTQWDVHARKMANNTTLRACIDSGQAISEYFNKVIDEVIEKADHVQFEGYKVRAVNFSSKKFTSDIGNKLATQYPPFGIVWYENDNILNVSLRSDGTVDVAEIAGRYYGGGHKAAAAFKIPFAGKFPWKILEKNNDA